VSIENVTQAASNLKRGQKRKWNKNPPKDKGAPMKKKLRDVEKVQCFHCEELEHFVKDYKKVRQD